MSFFGVPLRNGLPIGLGSGAGFGVPAFDPQQLFSNGEQGAWYDPSDFSTLFQDDAGVTPVTAVAQPVRLILDKSRGVSLGSQLMPNGGPFVNTTGWSGAASATVSAVSGNLRITRGATAGAQSATAQYTGAVIGAWYALTVNIVANPSNVNITVQSYGNTILANSATSSATGIRTIYYKADRTNPFVILRIETGAQNNYVDFSLVSVRASLGNHALAPSASSSPTLQQDSGGFLHLLFDGSNDCMSSNTIDFTGTNKITAWAGLTKLSDAARAMVAELGNNVTASIRIEAPIGASTTFGFSSGGTFNQQASVSGIAAPATRVLTGIGDISNDISTLLLNNVSVATNNFDQGTGNYSNNPLFIGARNNSTLWFNGRLYGLIVRGAQSTTSEISDAGLWMNGKTGAY